MISSKYELSVIDTALKDIEILENMLNGHMVDARSISPDLIKALGAAYAYVMRAENELRIEAGALDERSQHEEYLLRLMSEDIAKRENSDPNNPFSDGPAVKIAEYPEQPLRLFVCTESNDCRKCNFYEKCLAEFNQAIDDYEAKLEATNETAYDSHGNVPDCNEDCPF